MDRGAGAADVFISYAREDVATAERLAQVLESQGWAVWWDRDLVAGREFDRAIEEELEGAAAAIVIWSPASVNSRWVRSEASLAADRGILVPVVVGGAEMPLQFRTIQAVQLEELEGQPAQRGLDQLVGAIRSLVGDPAGAGPSGPESGSVRPPSGARAAPTSPPSAAGSSYPAGPDGSQGRSRRWAVLGAAAVGLLGLIVVGAALLSRGGDSPNTEVADTSGESVTDTSFESIVSDAATSEPVTSEATDGSDAAVAPEDGQACVDRGETEETSVVTFVNDGTADVDVYWVDGDCVEEWYATVPAGESNDQATFIGDLWRVRLSEDGSLLTELRVTESEESVSVP